VSSPNNSDSVCPNCKKPLKANAKFCGNCGHKITNDKQESSSQEPIVQQSRQQPKGQQINDNRTQAERSSPNLNFSRKNQTKKKTSQQSISQSISEEISEEGKLRSIIDSRRDLLFEVTFENELRELEEKLGLMKRYSSFKKADFNTLQKETNDVLLKIKESHDYTHNSTLQERAMGLVSASNELQLRMVEWMTIGALDEETQEIKSNYHSKLKELEVLKSEQKSLQEESTRLETILQVIADLKDHLNKVTEEGTTLKSAISWDYTIKTDLEEIEENLEQIGNELGDIRSQLTSMHSNRDEILTSDFVEIISNTSDELASTLFYVRMELQEKEKVVQKLSRSVQQLHWNYFNNMKDLMEELSDTQIAINNTMWKKEDDLRKEQNQPKLKIKEKFSDGDATADSLSPLAELQEAEPLAEFADLPPVVELEELPVLHAFAGLQKASYLLESLQEESDPIDNTELEIIQNVLTQKNITKVTVDSRGVQFVIDSWGINHFTLRKMDGKFYISSRKRNFLSRFTRIEFYSSEEMNEEFVEPFKHMELSVNPEERINSLLYFRPLAEKFLSIPGKKRLDMKNLGANTLYIEVEFTEISLDLFDAILELTREIDLVVNGI